MLLQSHFIFLAASGSENTTCYEDGSLCPLNHDARGVKKHETPKRIICEVGYPQAMRGQSGILEKGKWWMEHCDEFIFFIGVAINDKKRSGNIFGFQVNHQRHYHYHIFKSKN